MYDDRKNGLTDNMAIIKEENFNNITLEQVAYSMCLAARTAPKTRGMDLIETAVVTGDDLMNLIIKMEEIFQREHRESFKRNSESLKNCSCVVLIGAKLKTNGLKPCSLCGFENCASCEKNHAVCAFNPMDLGIAIGSAVSVAADNRVDNRVMWSIGMAALELKLFNEDVNIVMGIPLSASGKNIFFDRK